MWVLWVGKLHEFTVFYVSLSIFQKGMFEKNEKSLEQTQQTSTIFLLEKHFWKAQTVKDNNQDVCAAVFDQSMTWWLPGNLDKKGNQTQQ